MPRDPSFPEKLSVYLITEIHQRRISPYLNERGHKCRFYPSCSKYGLLAIEKYGFFNGWLKTIVRIVRCNPSNYQSHVDFP